MRTAVSAREPDAAPPWQAPCDGVTTCRYVTPAAPVGARTAAAFNDTPKATSTVGGGSPGYSNNGSSAHGGGYPVSADTAYKVARVTVDTAEILAACSLRQFCIAVDFEGSSNGIERCKAQSRKYVLRMSRQPAGCACETSPVSRRRGRPTTGRRTRGRSPTRRSASAAGGTSACAARCARPSVAAAVHACLCTHWVARAPQRAAGACTPCAVPNSRMAPCGEALCGTGW